MKKCYRIVPDNYKGYEVQIKKWWFPFWVQAKKYGAANTHSSLDDAKEWIKNGCPKTKKEKPKQIVYWQECK